MRTLTIRRPDDMHLHLRDGAAMRSVLADSVRSFARAIVMPNLRPPITTTALAAAYRSRIGDSLAAAAVFEPLMTLYLTDNTESAEIGRAKQSGIVHAVKYYPAGATTNSDSGVTDLRRCFRVLEAMERAGMPLLVHGEVTTPEVDIFDRERVFLETVLAPLLERFRGLKMVLEHITTREAAQFVTAAPAQVAATITAHHLLLNRNALFAGGVRPHHYCLRFGDTEVYPRLLDDDALAGLSAYMHGTDVRIHISLHTGSADATVWGCDLSDTYVRFNADYTT
jgi:dihydroorotase